jgi:hypothetical protein
MMATIAGGFAAGFGGDGGPPGSPSLLNTPAGLAIDGTGTLYIADSGNNRVRRIDGATGIITTVAGNGAAAFAGDGGPATAASLNSPTAVAVDAAGNLYIADAGNSRIRRVDAGSGIITTSAGTSNTAYNGDAILATVANLGFPTALQLNGAGNLLLTDAMQDRVRLIDTSTGLIWTIAGNGPNPNPACCGGGDAGPATRAFLSVPAGVALSPMGPLFISEHANHRVRQVALQNPLVSTAVSVTASSASLPPGSPLTLTAVLSVMNGSPANASGFVVFVDDATGGIASAPVVNGSSSFTTSSLSLGTHSLSGQYFGDSVFGPSISVSIGVTIANPQSSVALAANPNPARDGQPIALTATVTPTSATGSVNFFNGNTSLGTANINNGTATLAGRAFMPGSYSMTAQYSGDINLPGSTSPAITLTVKASSSVVVTSSANPSPPGQAVTFTATVSPSAATGTVQFLDNGSAIGTVSIMSGAATLSTSTLTSGSHSITASYGGDANDTSATSATLAQTILFSSSVVIASSQNPSPVGGPVTFTASVTPANATGTVQFLDGTTALGTGALSGGSASFTTSTLAQGTHYSITAAYSGDASNAGSTSAALIQTVKPIAVVTLASSLNPSTVSQTVTFTATVNNSGATGSMQFLDGAALLATVPVSSGAAAFSTSSLTHGTHSISTTYSGDDYYWGAQSPTLTQTVNLIATSTTLTSTPNPAFAGGAVTFTATVNPAAATGTVQFLDGTTVLGTGTLSSGSAAFTTSALTQGAHSITAVYGGDSADAGSTSAALSQSMKLSAGMTTGLSPSPGVTGQNVTITANVNAAATGTITFTDGTSVLATVPVASGSASYSTTALTQGSHTLGISYSGDATYMSQSTTIPETILAATSITLSSNANPAAAGQSITFTAAVTPAAATGSVQFYDGQTSLATVVLSGGTASYSTSTLTPGTHSITASYPGSSSYAPSYSNTLAEAVKTNTAVALASTPNPSSAGNAVTFTATVTPATATGAVQFLDGSTVLGTGTLSNGSASFATSALTQGTHSITAVYGGDASDTASTSTILSQSVKLTAGLTLASSLNPSTVGQTVTFTANVNAAATGTVQFLDGAAVLATVPVGSGAATFPTSALTQGIHSITATYSGDANYSSAQSSILSQTVNLTVTSTTLTSSWNPSLVGGTVTFNAMVSPTSATGAVQFLDGSTVLGTGTLSNGSASFATSALTQGAHSITAVYGGDAADAGSTSAVLSQSVKLLVGMDAFVNPSAPVAGQVVTLSATMNAAATGTVTFSDGNTVLATVAVASGAASYSTSSLAAGVHLLGFSYSGDATYMSSGTSFQQTIRAASSIALASSVNPAAAGQSVIFTATVTPAAATGNVQFYDGQTSLAIVALSGGAATYSTSALTPGTTHSITANYLGSSSYAPSNSNTLAEVVKANTSVVLASTWNPSLVGGAVTFNATVSPATATGAVQFLDGSTVLGTGTLSNGSASFTTSALTQGTHSITAVYGGDASDAGATSAVLSQSVKLLVGLNATVSPSAPVAGQVVTLSATMNAAATGTVTFSDGNTVLATVAVASGAASYSTSSLAAGVHLLGFSYSGDATYMSSGTSFQQTIRAASSITLASSVNPSATGQSVTFTAMVTPSAATGTVQFLDRGTAIGTATLASGTAVLATSSLAAGAHSITASYGGDANDAPASSAAVAQTVKSVASVSLTSSVNPSLIGQVVTFTAGVTPSAATGTVQFLDGTTVIGTVAVTSGAAAFSTSQLTQGTHSITASYSGDANDTAATSTALAQTVNPPPPAAPKNLTATAASSSQINLAWTASPTSGVTYDVYSSTVNNFTPSASNRIASGVTATSYAVTGLTPATKYYFRVTAVNAGGESAATSLATATTRPH